MRHGSVSFRLVFAVGALLCLASAAPGQDLNDFPVFTDRLDWCQFREEGETEGSDLFPSPEDICDREEWSPTVTTTIEPTLIQLNAALRKKGYRGIIEQHPFRRIRLGTTVKMAVDPFAQRGETFPVTTGDACTSLSEEDVCDIAASLAPEVEGPSVTNPAVYFAAAFAQNPYLLTGGCDNWAGRYRDLVNSFNHIVPHGTLNSFTVQSVPDKWYYCYFQAALDYAEEHDMTVSGSEIIQELPDWMLPPGFTAPSGCSVSKCTSGTDKERLYCLVSEQLLEVMGEFFPNERIASWAIAPELASDAAYIHSGERLGDFMTYFYDPPDPEQQIGRRPWGYWNIDDEGEGDDEAGDYLGKLFNDAWELGEGEYENGPHLAFYESNVDFAPDPANGVFNPKFDNAMEILQRIENGEGENDGVPVNMGLEMHVPAWAFLAQESGELRLSREQLDGIRRSLAAFGEYGNILIQEFDLRMGVPYGPDGCERAAACPDSEGEFVEGEGSDPCDVETAAANCEWRWMNRMLGRCWEALSYEDRAAWQAEVYRALMNLFLFNKKVEEITFYEPNDWESWFSVPNQAFWSVEGEGEGEGEDAQLEDDKSRAPFTPRWRMKNLFQNIATDGVRADIAGFHPDEAADPGLFTIYPLWPNQLCDIQSFYAPKPSYFAVETALKTFFGPAMVFATKSQKELVRLAATGDVVVFLGEIQTNQNPVDLDENFDDGDGVFKVRNADGDTVAVIADGEENYFYIAGDVHYRDSDGDPPAGLPANPDPEIGGLQISDSENNLQIWIDTEGNLYCRGDVIIDGIAMSVAPMADPPVYHIPSLSSCPL